jgi:hypothetical protein
MTTQASSLELFERLDCVPKTPPRSTLASLSLEAAFRQHHHFQHLVGTAAVLVAVAQWREAAVHSLVAKAHVLEEAVGLCKHKRLKRI